MRKRHHRGNTTPRVKVESPENPEKPTPENSAPSAQTKTDPNLDRKGWPVRVGSIIQIEDDIAVVKSVDNGALICRQLNDTNGGNNNAWSCRDVVVIPNLTYHEHEQGEREKSRSAVPEKLEMSRNGFAVRAGSILKRNGRVYRVTHQEHDWFTGETAEPGMVLTVTGMCGDYDVLPALATNDEEAATETESAEVENVNADANGKPIRVGDIVYEQGDDSVVGRVEVVHDGGCIYRILSGGEEKRSIVGTCNGFQCSDMVVQPRGSRPAPLPIHPDGKAIDAVKKRVDKIRESDPTVDDTGRPIKSGDIVCIDGPQYGRVEHVKEGCVLIRMFNWESPEDRKLVDWHTEDCTIVDEGGR